MENRGPIEKWVTHEEASKILTWALSHWKITYHYNRNTEHAELNLEDPETEDVMEVLFNEDLIWEIVITTETEMVRYNIRRDWK